MISTLWPIIWPHLKFFLITLVFFVIIFQYFRKKWQKKPFWQILFINLTILFFLLTISYQALEVYFRYIFDRSDNFAVLKTHKAWSQRHEKLNNDGCRDINHEIEKPSNIIRIAALGDSFVFGGGLSQVSDRFSDRLQKALEEKVPNQYEIFNVAFPGADTVLELEKLKKLHSLYKFDTVVLGYVLNDIGTGVDQKVWERSFCYLPGTWCWDGSHPLAAKILKNSYSLEFFYYRLLGFGKQTNQYKQWEIAAYQNPEQWAGQEAKIKALIDYCRSQNLKLMVVIFPYLQAIKPGVDYPYAWINEKLLNFFQKENILAIDLLKSLTDYQTQKLIVNPLDNHPSPLVHEKVSQLLLAKILFF